jgi:hypothetical protein
MADFFFKGKTHILRGLYGARRTISVEANG